MSVPKEMNPQRDFSAGEFDPDAKRRDDTPMMRAAARQLSNWRIRNSGAIDNRSGRRALFVGYTRVDEVTVAPGLTFRLCFAVGALDILTAAGALVLHISGRAWTDATVPEIVWSLVPRDALTKDVLVSYRTGVPLIVRWTLAGGWTSLNFAFGSLPDGGFQMPFFRLAPAGITLLPSGVTGSIALETNAPYFEAGMVGTMIRWLEQQILLTAYTDSTHMTGTVIRVLPITQLISLSSMVGTFNIGDIVLTTETNNRAEVAEINLSPLELRVTYLIPGFTWQAPQHVVGPTGTAVTSGTTGSTSRPSLQWDEQVFGNFRGWPRSNFFDQNRLGFCDIPGAPGAISYSAIGQYSDLTIGAEPADGFLEFAPEASRVYHVVAKGDELVFTDKGVFHIPISTSNPLKPGSVQFSKIGTDAAAQVRPVESTEGIIFVNASRSRIIAAVNTGVQNQPWRLMETSPNHAHLFRNVVAIATATGDGDFTERYVYALNADGTLAVGKLNVADQWLGWLPWSGAGLVAWVSALGGAVTICASYPGFSSMAEALDRTKYLDASILVNAPPAALTPPGGKGPFWWRINSTVALMDGVKFLGDYATDADGFVVPNEPGEDLSSATLTGGLKWQPVLEPFVPMVQGGQDQQQRMRRRRIARVAASVQNSTGFVMGSRRIPPYRQTDNADAAPPLREETYTDRPLGRAYDPRYVIYKDTPGPLTIVEVGMEVTV
jgi:hypothetical protein